MEKYSFFNAVMTEQGTYDRVYKAEDIASYFSSFIGNGVYPNPSSNLQVVSANDAMKINIKTGKAWINGYYYENTEDITFRIDNADAQYDRIDAVIIRLDFLERTITAQIKKGTPAIQPVAQTLQRDEDAYELKVAEVYIKKGVISISDADIKDTRQLSDVCGLVSGVVEQIDTSALFIQYDAAFNEWFEDIKDKLSGDIAGSLQTQINGILIDIPHLYKGTFTTDGWIGSQSPFTQTVSLSSTDGGSSITSNSVICSAPMCEQTSDNETNSSLLEALSLFNSGNSTLGNNAITVTVFEKPTINIDVIWSIKKGGA